VSRHRPFVPVLPCQQVRESDGDGPEQQQAANGRRREQELVPGRRVEATSRIPKSSITGSSRADFDRR
jgi:hypothetical protein